MKKLHFCLILIFLLIANTKKVNATHIRAGNITVVQFPNSLRVEITITAFTDTASPIKFGEGFLDLGDGTPPIDLTQAAEDGFATFTKGIPISDFKDVAKNIFVFSYTYPASGDYFITYTEKNRNEGILNMANSVETQFHIETLINITRGNQAFGVNTSPILLVPPIDKAARGTAWLHNPGAFDKDGDSLGYKLITPLKGRASIKDEKEGIKNVVSNYRLPNNAQFYPGVDYNTANEAPEEIQDPNDPTTIIKNPEDGPPTFSMDPLTGLVTWDAPGKAGEYNIAFIVEEWRKVDGVYIRLGFVERDMQIIVEEKINEKPEIEPIDDICVIAGEEINQLVIGTDPDEGEVVTIEAYSGIFNFSNNQAYFGDEAEVNALIARDPNEKISKNERKVVPVTSLFKWQTTCDHIRATPYDIVFKILDHPSDPNAIVKGRTPPLSNFYTWKITVIGPAPTGLKAEVERASAVNLNWDPYTCGKKASTMKIYRRNGSLDITPGECETGIPQGTRYKLVGTVDVNNNDILEWKDTNNGKPFSPGATYCYRIVAGFPLPDGGESIVSQEVCATFDADGPVITNVDVIETDKDNGKIKIKWLAPLKIDPSVFPTPYTYRILRSDILNPSDFTEITKTQAFEYTDEGLETSFFSYNYIIELYDANNTFIRSTSPASNVITLIRNKSDGFNLEWEADVPWNLESKDFPVHEIYRDNVDPDNPSVFQKIGETNVLANSFSYFDSNIDINNKDKEYCYFVSTFGSYENDKIPAPLINRSQVVCAKPIDEEAPCKPINVTVNDCKTYLDTQSCNITKVANSISWGIDTSTGCANDILIYDILYAPTVDEPFQSIGALLSRFTSYEHKNLEKLGGCYRIVAIDRSLNKSDTTDVVCVDQLSACTNYKLPNVFTPNGDGKNDTFTVFKTPDSCPRFVDHVNFQVYNRYGNQVYSYISEKEKSTTINWDGKSSDGTELNNGFYYYSIEVKFNVFDDSFASREFNGWIHLFR